ncbi:MAG: hypothetical protein QOJ40_1045 [Verrucomicrobiota bacterium]
MKHVRHVVILAPHWGFCLAALLLVSQAGLCALASTNAIIPYSVRIWQTDDGLPQNSVHAIAQTHDGYLWTGTHDGLARFDGARFTTLDDPAAPELKHAWITALLCSADGSLWIASDGNGVTRMKDGAFSRFSEAEGLPSNATRCLLEGSDGSIWIGSEGGVTRYKEGKFSNFSEKSGLGNNSVRALWEDRQGAIRIATMRGLSSLNKEGNVSTLNFGLGTVGNALKSVCQDAQGNLWVSSNEGLVRQEGSDRLAYGTSEGLPDKIVTVIFPDRGGQLWAGTYNGLARIVDGKVVPRGGGEMGHGDLIYTIFEDGEENLWVGARDGLYRLTPGRFTTYTTQQGLSCNNVMSVCEDKSGTIWVGTWGGGVSLMKENQFTAYGHTNGLTHDLVLSLHEGRDGSMWVGMDHGGGLNRLKGGPANLFPRRAGLLDAAIRVIHEDQAGAIWVGTKRGLNVFRQGKFALYTAADGLVGTDVMAICEDASGDLWIGTDGGLNRWHEGKFTSFTTHEGLSQNAVDALYEDADHVLWIGTTGGGLNRFKSGKFTAYGSKQGLSSDDIYEIVEDDFGCFWMSCRTGIFRVRKKDFDDLDRGTIKVLGTTSFGKADGLLSVQCNGVSKPAGWKGKDGRIWFPTIRGVVAVQSGIKTNQKIPPVVIEEIFADKRLIEHQRVDRAMQHAGSNRSPAPVPLTIPPGRGEIEIHYTALSFQAPEKNRFKYMMEGIDPGWIDAGATREAHYNSISPGSYRFRIIACNNDGIWNEAGATLLLEFRPHFWQTWSFKLALLAAFGLLLSAAYRFRVARLRALERLRIQIANDLHDDVGARLTKVAMVTEFVDRETRPDDGIKPHIQNIARTTREIIQAMDEIVWTINPKNDTLDNLANYIFQYAQEYFQHTGVRCRLDLPARLPDFAISTEQRHNMFMAFKEALNNVLKHASATEVRVGLTVADGQVTILIADNGSGFSTEAARSSSGNGLDNMKQRLERIGGKLVLDTTPAGGTTVRMEADVRS